MRVLVTGHRGYIGVELVPLLRKAGFDVVGLDTGFFDDSDFRAPPDEVFEIDVDLRDVTPDHLRGFGAVVHLGALSNDPLGDLNPGLTYDINLHASVNLARAAKTAGVGRYVFASSCSLYGAGADGHLDEQAAFNPVTPYGESKVRTELEVGPLADERFAPVYLRNATAYGASRRLRADIVVNNLVGHALTTGKVTMTSDGTPWRPLVHIGDISRGVIAALTAPADAVRNQAFNIGRTQENFRIRDVAEMVAQVVPNCEVSFAAGASPDTRNYRVDFSKAEKSLPGYTPQWTLRAGIEELYDAYKSHGMTRDEFLGPRYYRLKVIRGRIERGELDNNLRWL
ncbi:MAG TPA: SDR family oxidoreductase [Kofleriaceae bacterium]|jgi:nucleoside-diphosphate-sugar epimerase